MLDISDVLEEAMKNEQDLRVRKTRSNIQNALMALMKEKPLARIKVVEICQEAQCSRNTFYSHYPYKEAVLQRMTEECVSQIVSDVNMIIDNKQITVNEADIFNYSELIIKSISKEREKVQFLLNHEDADRFSILLTDAVQKGLVVSASRLVNQVYNDPEYQLYCRYIAGGVVSFMLYWLGLTGIEKKEAVRILHNINLPPVRVCVKYLEEHGRKAIVSSNV